MSDLKDKVESALAEVRPYLQFDGGDSELVDVSEDGRVSVRLQGACYGCPASIMTLKMGVEKTLKEKVPEVKEVISVD